jgi:hypothetical protein
MSDNGLEYGKKTVLLTGAEFTAQMGGVKPDEVFMVALAMMLTLSGGHFSYSQTELASFRAFFGDAGQLGITVEGDQVHLFIYNEPVVRA